MPWWGWLLLGTGIPTALLVAYFAVRWVTKQGSVGPTEAAVERARAFEVAAVEARAAEGRAREAYEKLLAKIQLKAKEREIEICTDAVEEAVRLGANPAELDRLLDAVLGAGDPPTGATGGG